MKFNRVVAGCASCALALSLVACGGSGSSSSASSSSEQASSSQSSVVEEQKDANAKQVLGTSSDKTIETSLINGLKANITSVCVRVSSQGEYGSNLLAKDATIKANEEVTLYAPKTDKADATYDIKVKVSGKDAEQEFLGVPLTAGTKATLVEESGVCYVNYVDASGTKGSTKDAAAKKKATDDQSSNSSVNAEAAALGAAALGANPEEENGTEELYEEPEEYEVEEFYNDAPAEEFYVEEEPVEYSEPEPAPSSDAPAQSGDACTGDVVLRY